MDPFEPAMRSIIKKHVGRGHIDIRVQLASSLGGSGLDLDKVATGGLYARRSREAAKQYGIAEQPRSQRCVPNSGHSERDGRARTARRPSKRPSLQLLEQALTTLNEFRAREGAELGRGDA